MDGETSEVTTGRRGRREWRLDGQLHRTDGPAIETPGGAGEWWIGGRPVPEQVGRRWAAATTTETRCAAYALIGDGFSAIEALEIAEYIDG